MLKDRCSRRLCRLGNPARGPIVGVNALTASKYDEKPAMLDPGIAQDWNEKLEASVIGA